MSLKVRLIAVLCALVIVALAATDAITYASFRSYVVGQIDSQLTKSADSRFEGLWANLASRSTADREASPPSSSHREPWPPY